MRALLISGLIVAFAAAPAQARTLTLETSLRAASPSPTEHARIIRIPRTSSGPLSDDERYSIREAIAKEARNFRGGDEVVVISTTAAIIVLLAVIIVILLV